MAHITMMTGAMMLNGMRRIAANSGTQVSTITSPIRLPRYMLAMRPQTKSFCSTKRSGPGCRPQINRPPRSTAAVGEPGTPKASIGSSPEVPAARAGRADAHPTADQARAQRRQPVARQQRPGLQHHLRIDGDGAALEAQPLLHGEQDLAD